MSASGEPERVTKSVLSNAVGTGPPEIYALLRQRKVDYDKLKRDSAIKDEKLNALLADNQILKGQVSSLQNQIVVLKSSHEKKFRAEAANLSDPLRLSQESPKPQLSSFADEESDSPYQFVSILGDLKSAISAMDMDHLSQTLMALVAENELYSKLLKNTGHNLSQAGDEHPNIAKVETKNQFQTSQSLLNTQLEKLKEEVLVSNKFLDRCNYFYELLKRKYGSITKAMRDRLSSLTREKDNCKNELSRSQMIILDGSGTTPQHPIYGETYVIEFLSRFLGGSDKAKDVIVDFVTRYSRGELKSKLCGDKDAQIQLLQCQNASEERYESVLRALEDLRKNEQDLRAENSELGHLADQRNSENSRLRVQLKSLQHKNTDLEKQLGNTMIMSRLLQEDLKIVKDFTSKFIQNADPSVVHNITISENDGINHCAMLFRNQLGFYEDIETDLAQLMQFGKLTDIQREVLIDRHSLLLDRMYQRSYGSGSSSNGMTRESDSSGMDRNNSPSLSPLMDSTIIVPPDVLPQSDQSFLPSHDVFGSIIGVVEELTGSTKTDVLFPDDILKTVCKDYLNSVVGALKNMMDELKNSVNECEGRLNEVAKKLDESTKEVDNLNAQLKQVRSDLATEKGVVTQLEGKIATLEKDNKECQTELNEAQADIKNLQTENELLTESLADSGKLVIQLQNEVNSLNGNITALKGSVDFCQRKYSLLYADHTKLEGDHEYVNEEWDKCKTDLKDLEGQLHQEKIDCKERLSSLVADMSSNCSKVEQVLIDNFKHQQAENARIREKVDSALTLSEAAKTSFAFLRDLDDITVVQSESRLNEQDITRGLLEIYEDEHIDDATLGVAVGQMILKNEAVIFQNPATSEPIKVKIRMRYSPCYDSVMWSPIANTSSSITYYEVITV